MKTSLHSMLVLILLVFLATVTQALADDINLVDCSGITSCTVSTFRADVPELFSQDSLSLVEPLPIGINHIANVDLSGTVTAIICNNSWQDLPSVSPVLQNQIRCSVDDDEPYMITADVRIYDQTTFTYTYPNQPSTLGFTYLAGTTPANPYCVSETSPDTATACQWEEQEGSDWLVYSVTEAEHLVIGESTGTGGGGGVEITGDICINNEDGNEYIEEWEWGQCPYVDESETDQICLLDAVECLATTSTPICLDGGTLNTDSDQCEVSPQNITCHNMYTYNQDLDKCERDPYCEDDGVFNGDLDRCEIVVSGNCPNGYVYDQSLDACIKTPDCAGTGVYDPAQDACVSAVIQFCPGNYTLAGTVCTDSPICPIGTNYNTSLDQCVVSDVLTCPGGYTQQGELCVRQPSCPIGGQYNSITNRCEYNPCSVGVCAEETQLTPVGIETYKPDWNICSHHPEPPCYQYNKTSVFCNYTGDLENINQANAYSWPIIEPQNSDNFHNKYPYLYTPLCYYKPEETEDPPCDLVAFNCDGDSDRLTKYYMSKINGFRCTLDNQVYSTQAECSSQCSSCSSCTGGYEDIGSLCAANPSCPNGGTLNGTTDQCEVAMTHECPTGSTYDESLSLCTAQASCANGGILNPGLDRCDIIPTPTCQPAYTLDGNICRSPAICAQGSYDQDLDICRLQVSELCPSTYTYDSDDKVCTADFYCFNQSVFATTVNMCLLDADHECPDTYSYNPASLMCEAYPICQAGVYREDTDDCYEGDNTCPYGESYDCKPYNEVNLCSPYECVNVSDSETSTDNETETGANDKEDDGEVDPGGNCLGTVYIYNGKDNRCRSWGVTLYFAGCCNSDTYLLGTMDCDEDEKMLSMKKNKGLCHYVGEYDSKHVSLGFGDIVTEKKKTYCCFNSKLSRIIHEQGRPQLIEFSQEGWGTPENPNCRGFNPEEFQMIDFQKVDMSEWSGDIQVKAVDAIQSDIQTEIEADVNP